MTDQILLDTPDATPEQLQMLTRQFCRDLTTELRYDCRLPQADGRPGQRGDPVTLGAIVVALATSGTILGFIRLVQTYISRVPSLEMTIVRQDGSRFMLKASNLTDKQLHATEAALDRFWSTVTKNE